MTNKETKI